MRRWYSQGWLPVGGCRRIEKNDNHSRIQSTHSHWKACFRPGPLWGWGYVDAGPHSVLLILTLGAVCPLVHYLVHLSLFLYLYNGSNVYIWTSLDLCLNTPLRWLALRRMLCWPYAGTFSGYSQGGPKPGSEGLTLSGVYTHISGGHWITIDGAGREPGLRTESEVAFKETASASALEHNTIKKEKEEAIDG